MPPEQLPGLIAGRAEVGPRLALLAGPLTAVDLPPGRAALRRALAVLPQSGLDPNCYEHRWRGRVWKGGEPLEVCALLRLTGQR